MVLKRPKLYIVIKVQPHIKSVIVIKADQDIGASYICDGITPTTSHSVIESSCLVSSSYLVR